MTGNELLVKASRERRRIVLLRLALPRDLWLLGNSPCDLFVFVSPLRLMVVLSFASIFFLRLLLLVWHS